MEEMKMRKVTAIMLAVVLAVSCAACGTEENEQQNQSTSITDTDKNSSEKTDGSTDDSNHSQDSSNDSTDSKEYDKDEYKVAIVQQLDHPSLDEIRKAIEAELSAGADKNGITIAYDEFQGQNDATVLNQIGTQVVSDQYDCIIPIASLAAQCMQVATEDDQIPVVFAAVTDPVNAGLVDSLDVPGANITGTSDYLDTEVILDMMFAQNPEIASVGLLYNKSEDSSELPIAKAKEYLDEKNISYVEKTGTTSDEIAAACDSMLDQVDAVFTPTDNTVAAAELMLTDKFIAAGVPHYTGADSFVRNGAFATCGVNYTDLGTQTADIVLDVLKGADTKTYPVKVMEGGIITVNTETAEALKLDYSCFHDMCSKLVEVQTSED